jgi:hypothetical protein
MRRQMDAAPDHALLKQVGMLTHASMRLKVSRQGNLARLYIDSDA